MSEFSQIRYESADRVATITLHRPDRLNAFTTTMARELVAAFDAADADDDVRVVLMTGAGRAFCAGADLGRGASTFDATDPVRAAERAGFETIGGVPRDGGGTVSLRIAASRKPVIVAVNGPAVGVGATMTLPETCGSPGSRRGSGSCSHAAAWSRRPRRAGSCPGLSGSRRRWSG